MTYVLRECTNAHEEKMNQIWDSIWMKSDLNKLMMNIEKDELLPVLLKYLPKRGKILEAGCGLGQWVFFLRSKGYDILGIDFAENTIQSLKRIDMEIPLEIGDVNNTEFPDSYFDAYISLGVVEHFQNGPFQALQEAKRILRRNGLMLISVPVFNYSRRIMSKLESIYCLLRENQLVRRLQGKNKYPQKSFIEFRFTIKEFEEILKKEKFVVVNKVPWVHNAFSLFNYYLEPPRFLIKNKFIEFFFDLFSSRLKKISPWISPHQVIWICLNEKS